MIPPRRTPIVASDSSPKEPARLAVVHDDAELIAAIGRGDERAFEALFRRYVQPLYALALRYLKSHADAEDVAQEVLLKLWERRTTLVVRGSVRAYLYTLARNHAVNTLRGRTRREGGAAAGHGLPDLDAVAGRLAVPGMGVAPVDPERAMTAAEQTAILKAAIGALSPRRREILALRWEHGLSYAEIGSVLGISVRAAEQTHARAVRELRRTLPAALGARLGAEE
jgi:RNA polymerase sigma factor (sigma-70 family)